MPPVQNPEVAGPSPVHHLERGLSLFDSTMLVAGSMIGSGIFIVSSEMSRQIGSAGWLLGSWLLTGILTIAAALSYGELAAMMPRAGGQYVYLREAFSPLGGFLYGWTLFLVIQTGTIAAVGVGFARYLGILWPPISENRYIIQPIHITPHYALSLSTAQLVAILVIAFLTGNNMLGIRYGKAVQNLFTCAKIGALLAVIVLGIFVGWNASAVRTNFSHLWTAQGVVSIAPGLSAVSAWGLLVAICVSQTGSLFSADAWNNITFTAGEVRNPRRNVPLSLFFGASLVIALYMLANLAYLVVLPMNEIQHAPADRVAGTMLSALFPAIGSSIMALVIMVSGFGCINGLVLSGARAYYAMACDGVFFRTAAKLNRAHVPGAALVLQMVWSIILVLIRTYDPATGVFGNLYSNLLDYVISAALIFYILTIAGVFVLRKRRPDVERPYKAFAYPVVPALYILGAVVILIVLFVYRPATTFPGLVIALLGVPVYLLFRRFNKNTSKAES
jgi:APA family basic amino acid/polyamine antiporter